MDKFTQILIFWIFTTSLQAQESENPWKLDGLFLSQMNVALKDPKIGAANTPFYEEHKWGGEAWLNLQAYNKNWRIETRLDGYQNSILRNPEEVYTAFGLGYFNAKYSTRKFSVEAGHFYDQIGHGLIMRSYRDLTLLIDNSILGLKAKWHLPQNQSLMIYGGKPKSEFSLQDMFNVGGEYRKGWSLNSVYFSSGVGASWKRFESSYTDALIDEVRFYHPSDSLALYRNGVLATVFQEMTAGPVTWNAEYAMKYHDPYFNPLEKRSLITGGDILGRFETKPGHAFYSQLALDFPGVSISVEGKYIQRFVNKSDAFSFDYRNDLNFIPPATDIQTYRLKARYIPATQFIGEKSVNLSLFIPLNKHLFEWRNSLIFQLGGTKLYEDYDIKWTLHEDQTKWVGGMMYQLYNQSIYEGKGGQLIIRSLIPYMEYYTTFGEEQSLKVQSQALITRQDKGSLFFLSSEYGWNKDWTLNVSGMFQPEASLFYPGAGLFFRKGNGRYGLSFVRQLEGYVCSGGICRYEPAYSGFKLEIQQRI